MILKQFVRHPVLTPSCGLATPFILTRDKAAKGATIEFTLVNDMRSARWQRSIGAKETSGGEGGSRTPDLWVMNPPL